MTRNEKIWFSGVCLLASTVLLPVDVAHAANIIGWSLLGYALGDAMRNGI